MSSFKSSIFIVSLIFIITDCQAADDQPRMHNFFGKVPKEEFAKCLDEAGLTKDELKAFRDNPPKEPNAKHLCFIKCMTTAAGLIDKNGMIVSDLIKKNLPTTIDEATGNTIIKCMEAVGKISTCDDITKLKKCIPKPSE